MIAFVAMLCALGAFLLFGCATDRHHQQRFGRRLDRHHAKRCQMVAWSAIALCLLAAISAWGWVIGPVAWAGLIMAGAAASFLVLNLAPKPDHDRRAKAANAGVTRGFDRGAEAKDGRRQSRVPQPS